MRHDAPYLVMRYAAMIGRPETRRRVTVAHQAYALDHAIEWARNERELAARNPPGWFRRADLWIERRGRSARRPAR